MILSHVVLELVNEVPKSARSKQRSIFSRGPLEKPQTAQLCPRLGSADEHSLTQKRFGFFVGVHNDPQRPESYRKRLTISE